MKPTSMIEGERPQVNFECVGPVQKGMLHHGPRLLGDSANGTLSDSILMMSADAGKVKFLIDEISAELVGLEDTVVAVVALDLLSARLCDALEGPF